MNPTKVLFTTDLSGFARAAWEPAFSMARDTGAELFVLYVDQPPVFAPSTGSVYDSPQAMLDAEVESLLESKNAVTLRRHVAFGEPRATIVQFAKDHGVDLIVMSTHGRSGVTRLLMGSVAERVVRSAPCPVLTLRVRGEKDRD